MEIKTSTDFKQCHVCYSYYFWHRYENSVVPPGRYLNFYRVHLRLTLFSLSASGDVKIHILIAARKGFNHWGNALARWQTNVNIDDRFINPSTLIYLLRTSLSFDFVFDCQLIASNCAVKSVFVPLCYW